MKPCKFLPVGSSQTVRYACRFLAEEGYPVTDVPEDSVTHVLLNVPCTDSAEELGFLLERLPKDVIAVGGKLPALPCRSLDLLEDPVFVWENANITAYCAAALAAENLPVIFSGLPVLILGWGRIGKCLAKRMDSMGAEVTVAARKESDRAMIHALGYQASPISCHGTYRVIFNTVPEMILPECPEEALKIDLASQPGIGGKDVIRARGLPGKMAPESAGKQMALRTVAHWKEVSL